MGADHRIRCFPGSDGTETEQGSYDERCELACRPGSVTSSRDLPVLPAMPPELLFCLAWFLISPGVFLPSDGTGWKRATATVSQAERHRDRVRSGLGKTVTLIQAAARRVCEQIYVRTRWRCSLDTVQQRCKDRIAQALPLVFGQYGHIDDVEVPPAVAEQPAHADDCSRLLVYYVACGPGASQACSALLFRLRGKTCLRAKAQVVLNRRRRHHERVARHHTRHSGSSEGGVSSTVIDGNPDGDQSSPVMMSEKWGGTATIY